MTINRREFLRALVLGVATAAAAAVTGLPPIDEIGDGDGDDDTEWPPEDDESGEWVDDVWLESWGGEDGAQIINSFSGGWYSTDGGKTWTLIPPSGFDGWHWASNFQGEQ